MPYNISTQQEDVWRIPLVGGYNSRVNDSSTSIYTYSSTTTTDQRFINAVPTKVANPSTGATSYYVSKRPGWESFSTPSAGGKGVALCYWPDQSTTASSWDNANTLYLGTTSTGSFSGIPLNISYTKLGSTAYLVMACSDASMWMITAPFTFSNTFTADTSNGVTTLTNVSSTTSRYVGQALSGTGIQAGTRIVSIDSATQITMSLPATATNAGVTITHTVAQKITDTDFPGNASRTITGGFVFMDDYAFIMDTTGRIYNSDNGNFLSWTALNYIATIARPDSGVGLIRYKNSIMAFGGNSIEFLRNVGNELGSPLERMDQYQINIGCVGPRAYTAVGDTVAWLANTAEGGVGVYVLDNYQPKRISTPSIEKQLSRSTSDIVMGYNNEPAFANTYKYNGQTFVSFTVGYNTYVYCMETELWHEMGGATVLWHNIVPTGTGLARTIYAQSVTDISGKIYKMDPASMVYQDNGVAYNMIIQTSKVDGNNSMRKWLPQLRLIGDQAASTNNVSISWSDDDYQNFSTARTIDMANADPNLKACGSFKRRAFKITHAGNAACRLEALELYIKQGTH
jgi:hypothetical protein